VDNLPAGAGCARHNRPLASPTNAATSASRKQGCCSPSRAGAI